MAKRGVWDPIHYLEDPEPPESEPLPTDLGPATARDLDRAVELPAQLLTTAAGEAEAAPTILPIRLIEPPMASLTYELTFGGRQLRLPADFEVQRVARLVRTLEAATC